MGMTNNGRAFYGTMARRIEDGLELASWAIEPYILRLRYSVQKQLD
jgi:hypothetical protein